MSSDLLLQSFLDTMKLHARSQTRKHPSGDTNALILQTLLPEDVARPGKSTE